MATKKRVVPRAKAVRRKTTARLGSGIYKIEEVRAADLKKLKGLKGKVKLTRIGARGGPTANACESWGDCNRKC